MFTNGYVAATPAAASVAPGTFAAVSSSSDSSGMSALLDSSSNVKKILN